MQPTVDQYILLCAPACVVGVWQYIRVGIARPIKVRYSAAVDGAKLLREWCTWLATLATGSIGLTAFIPNGNGKGGICSQDQVAGALSVAAFGVAIVFTATLLLALPSLIARFRDKSPSTENDFYESIAFSWAEPLPLAPLFRVGFLAFGQYYFFVAGVVGFASCASIVATTK